MYKFLIMLAMAVLTSLPARATVSIDIGINVPSYPTLQRIPGYPVYYVPRMHANYFFYDGLYWVYAPDGWYVSPWYDGPWDFVAIDSVPLFILRIPVRYYGYPPVIFREWVRDAPPRWDRVWGPDWARRHQQWEHWNRAATPAPAPLPRYQQRFTRANYPNEVQRRELVQEHYRYTPRDNQARQHWQEHGGPAAVQPPARPMPQHQTQAPPVRSVEREARPNNHHPVERDEAPAQRHGPPRSTIATPPEPPPMRANGPHPGPGAGQPRFEEREAPRNAKPEHGGRQEKPGKDDKDEHQGQGRHH